MAIVTLIGETTLIRVSRSLVTYTALLGEQFRGLQDVKRLWLNQPHRQNMSPHVKLVWKAKDYDTS